MKKIISVCMIFVVILMSFTACDKFREITNGGHNKSEINDERALHLNDSGSPEPAANNKESWSEWTSRQWNENRIRWIGSIVGTALVATGLYFSYKWLTKKEKMDIETQTALSNKDIETQIAASNEIYEQYESLNETIAIIESSLDITGALDNFEVCSIGTPPRIKPETVIPGFVESLMDFFTFSARNFTYFSAFPADDSRVRLLDLTFKAFEQLRAIISRDDRITTADRIPLTYEWE
jgi:hypothetical protein